MQEQIVNQCERDQVIFAESPCGTKASQERNKEEKSREGISGGITLN